jgi:alpha-N-arabinofuranosidase
VVAKDYNPDIQLTEQEDGWYLTIKMDKAWSQQKKRELVTTELLGKAVVPGMAFEQPDGKPICIDTDYFGNKRNMSNPIPGPFETVEDGKVTHKVWNNIKESE